MVDQGSSSVSLPPAAVRPVIAASWQRCRALGLDPALPPAPPRPVAPEELGRRQLASAELLEVARPHLDWLTAMYAAVPHVAYLVDRDGILLYATRAADEANRTLGRPGADWSEAAMGTNGAGTALVAGEPVTVEGPEHFLQAFQGYTCTGTPVRSPAGDLLGALNISTRAGVPLGVAERLRLVAHAAYAVEQELRYRESLQRTSRQLEAERRVAEERGGRLAALVALEASEARFRGAFDYAAIGMAITSPEGRWLRVNRALCEILGFEEPELIGSSFQAFTHPDDVDANAGLFARALAGEIDRYQMEKRFLSKGGALVWVTLNAVLVRDAAGAPQYFLAQMQDITARKATEAALRESEARYESIAANVPGMVYQYVYRADGTQGYTYVSEGVRQLLGVAPDQALHDPATLLDRIHPADRPRFRELALAAAAALGPFRWEGRVVLPSGEVRFVQVGAQDHRRPDGGVASDGIVMDITERRRAAQRLEESEQRLRSLVDRNTDAVFSLDLEGRIVEVNPACERLCGYLPEEILGLPFAPLVAPEQLAVAMDRFGLALRGTPQTFEAGVRHKSGRRVEVIATCIPIVLEGRVVGVFGVVKDVTEQRSLQEQLRQAQKMEAVGRLAGGIAHDFNNLLTAILSNTELVLRQLADGPIRQDVETIRQTAERAAALTRQLLAFSRKQVIQPRQLDLNELVQAAERMLRRTLAADIEVTMEPAPALPPVLADPSQLEQVLLNLVVNAGDAMPEGGTLTVRTGTVVVDEAYARRHRGLRPGHYVTLAVADTGVGIPPELQTRIFEPFFTTKDVDRGTGLGLATVYGIVKQYGGYTAVQSRPGHGTTFTVYLPSQVRELRAVEAVPQPAAQLPTGTETILVVEDESAVRTSIRRILSLHGYTVLEARHGADALHLTEAADCPAIDLVMTDLVMPEMGGRELISRLRARGTPPRILAMSGYDEQAANRGEPLPAGTRLLEKPFTIDGLLRTVRSALDAGAGPGADRA